MSDLKEREGMNEDHRFTRSVRREGMNGDPSFYIKIVYEQKFGKKKQFNNF